MNHTLLTLGKPCILRETPHARILHVKVVELHSEQPQKFVRVEQPCGRRFWCSPEQLFEPGPERSDPDGFSLAERKLFDAVAAHGPLKTGDLAAIINGNPEQKKPWTASTVAAVAKRPRLVSRFKFSSDGKHVVIAMV
jgi:hypothetical protein